MLHRIEAARAYTRPRVLPPDPLCTYSSFPTENSLRQSRSRLRVARAASQDAFERYKHCADQELTLEAEVQRAEERLDELSV